MRLRIKPAYSSSSSAPVESPQVTAAPGPPRPERFDVLDASGQPTGRTRRRDLVHRHGDWHRAFHCWIVLGTGAGPHSVILQRRADDKDTWPGALDVSVGGHYRAGESLADVIREMPERLSVFGLAAHSNADAVAAQILDGDRGIVDQNTHRQRQPTQGHDVEGFPQCV